MAIFSILRRRKTDFLFENTRKLYLIGISDGRSNLRYGIGCFPKQPFGRFQTILEKIFLW